MTVTVVQALALDYLTALYTYNVNRDYTRLLSLHARNNRIIVTLWRLFRAFLRPFLFNLNIETSLIESVSVVYNEGDS